jgi:hypothetical protein
MAWNVQDEGSARQRLATVGVGIEEGEGVLGGLTLAPADMFGARHELVRLP